MLAGASGPSKPPAGYFFFSSLRMIRNFSTAGSLILPAASVARTEIVCFFALPGLLFSFAF